MRHFCEIGIARTANADALIQKLAIIKAAGVNAALSKAESKTIAFNGVLQKTLLINAGLSALVQKLNVSVTTSSNGLLEKRGVLHTANLHGALQKNIITLATLNAALQSNVLKSAQANGLALKNHIILSASLDGVIAVFGVANARNLIKASGKSNVRAGANQPLASNQPDDFARAVAKPSLVKVGRRDFPKP